MREHLRYLKNGLLFPTKKFFWFLNTLLYLSEICRMLCRARLEFFFFLCWDELMLEQEAVLKATAVRSLLRR